MIMEIKCNYCNYEWNYGGMREYYAQCPTCRCNVRIYWSAEQLELIRQMKKEIKKEKERGESGEQVTNTDEEEV